MICPCPPCKSFDNELAHSIANRRHTTLGSMTYDVRIGRGEVGPPNRRQIEQNQLISEHDKGWEHGCQMVIVDSLECMCLPLGLKDYGSATLATLVGRGYKNPEILQT